MFILLLIILYLLFPYVHLSGSLAGALNSNNSSADNFVSCLTLEHNVNPASIIQRSSPLYEQLNYQYNQLLPIILPAGYLLVKKASDIQAAVRCGRTTGFRVVPKSGGHGYTKYAFGDEHTLVINLQQPNFIQVTVNRTTGTATVGPGILVGQLAYQLWAQGRYVTGLGICHTVGISGLTLGGGFSHFSRLYGLATDNVVEMKMVNAAGDLLTLNKDTNPNLFWALRGAGTSGSFGIVTEFKFQLYSAPVQVVSCTLQFQFKYFTRVFTIWHNYFGSKTNPPPPRWLNSYFNIKAGRISIELVDLRGDESILEDIVKLFPTELADTEIISKTTEFSAWLLASSLAGGYPAGYQPPVDHLTGNASDLMNLTFYPPMYRKAKSFYVQEKMVDISKFEYLFAQLSPYNITVIFELCGGAINTIPAFATAFVHRHHLYMVQMFQSSLQHDPQAEQILDNVYEHTKELLHHTESYQNYVDKQLEEQGNEYLYRYYGSNLERLVQIKNEVDPDNYFWNPQSIPIRMPNSAHSVPVFPFYSSFWLAVLIFKEILK